MTENSPNMYENEESTQNVWVTRINFLNNYKMGGHYKMILASEKNVCKMTPPPLQLSTKVLL